MSSGIGSWKRIYLDNVGGVVSKIRKAAGAHISEQPKQRSHELLTNIGNYSLVLNKPVPSNVPSRN